MKKLSSIASIFKRTKKMTPKQRVREIMEVGSGHKWLLDKDEDDSLSYTSKENGTPGLCLFFDGHATLSPETRIRRFDFGKGDFFFDDPPEDVMVFSGKEFSSDADLKKALQSFFEKWLSRNKWVYRHDKIPQDSTDGNWVRWYFKHTETVCPMLAIGEIEFTDMPCQCQINIEKLMEAEKTDVDKLVKHILCITLIQKT